MLVQTMKSEGVYMFKKIYITIVSCFMAFMIATPIITQAIENAPNPFVTSNITSSVLQRRGGNKDGNQGRRAYLEEMKKRWDSLSKEQKTQVYDLKEKELHEKFTTIDKLVELGVTDESHATMQKKRMQDRFNEIKSNGEFPCRLSYQSKNK